MKQSFHIKITCFLLGTIALTIMMCWFLNRTLLAWYYTYTKVSMNKEVYEEVNDYISVVDEDRLTEEQKEKIDRIEATENVKIYLFQEVEMQSSYGTIYFTYFVYPEQVILPHNEQILIRDPGSNMSAKREYYRIYESAQEYTFPNLFASSITEVDTVVEREEYKIMTQHNTTMESRFMDLYGTMDCGYSMFVRSGLESIEEAANISNRFLFILGCFVILIAATVSYVFSRRFTKPVLDLAQIAHRMSELDFSTKYPVDGEDEIAVLGSSINSLSEKLEHTIFDLKRVNIELQNDIDRKTQADEVRKEFLSNVTHELKTPIALIQGYAEGLKDNITEDAESRDFYCEVIIDEAMKMNKMVKKLLSLNQLEFGTAQPEFERFDLTLLVESVLNATEILFLQKKVQLLIDMEESVYVWADEYMIEEVLNNYISNALNHVSGENRIEIRTKRIENRIRLSVFNTGTQIPKEDIDKIWIKFYKVDKARTREYGGSGIGLSIVKAVMDLHRCEYGVINRENGVEFYFELDAGDDLSIS